MTVIMNAGPEFEFHHYAIVDRVASQVPGFLDEVGLVPSFGAVSIAARQLGWQFAALPAQFVDAQGKVQPFTPQLYVQTWQIGIAYCSPHDLKRFNAKLGGALALDRATTEGAVVSMVCAEATGPFHGGAMLDKLGIFDQMQGLPRWLQHLLDLKDYIVIRELNKGDIALLSTLGKKIFNKATSDLARQNAELREANKFLVDAYNCAMENLREARKLVPHTSWTLPPDAIVIDDPYIGPLPVEDAPEVPNVPRD